METVKNQITDFLNKCEEIKNCKFIMATTKIKDLLKSIVNSAELYELFNTVASGFDYAAAKQRCFKAEGEGVYTRCSVALPETVGDRLAFIFCLLVEFDRNDVNFNAFLQKFYPKDGSYYASYHLFCDEIIGSLQSIISDIYSRELAEELPPAQPQLAMPQGAEISGQAEPAVRLAEHDAAPYGPDVSLAEQINTVCMFIEAELSAIDEAQLSGDDKAAARSILCALISAVKACNAEAVKGLISGYNYFVLYSGEVTTVPEQLFNAIGDYLERL